MHDDELHVDAEIVRDLLADQFPAWRSEPVVAVTGAGTVNAIFRIGRHHSARLPLQGADPGEVLNGLRAEAAALTELAASTRLPSPAPVAIGAPGAGYPLPWAIQTWLDGETATANGLAASVPLAQDLAELIGSLRRADTRGRRFAGRGRGGDLRHHDDWMALCFRESEGLLPVPRLREAWEALRDLPPGRPDVMTHGDLIPPNLLVRDGRLAGVLDGGGFGPADPSLDLVAAWHLLDPRPRRALREALAADDLEWRRGAAWAFLQSMGLVWYYRRSNPVMSALGRSTLMRVLDDPELGL
jgi:aminoglycoside phosphotransferase (APT) family kinase protein